MALKFNPFTGTFDLDSTGAITEGTVDLASGAWVLRTDPPTDGEAGEIRVLGLPMLYAGPQGVATYQFSFKTQAGDIKRVDLT